MSEAIKTTGSITVADVDALIAQMYDHGRSEPDAYIFLISAHMKNCLDACQARYEKRLRWFTHCDKAYHLPARKLRKCHMRKVARRRQRERGRYL